MRGRLAFALTVLLIGLVACGDSDEGDGGGAATPTEVESPSAADGDEPIVQDRRLAVLPRRDNPRRAN